MSEFTGADAFDRLVDRIIDLVAVREASDRRCNVAEGERNEVRRDAINHANHARHLEQARERAKPKLEDLHKAVEAALAKAPSSPEVDALKVAHVAAMNACPDYSDSIPF